MVHLPRGAASLSSDDRYILRGVLAQGEVTETHFARRIADETGPKRVVLERPSAVVRSHAQATAVFEEGARMAHAFAHAHVPRVFEAGMFRQAPFLAHEFLQGVNLGRLHRRLLGSLRHIPLAITARVLLDALDVLAAAELSAGEAPLSTVHGDISPETLFITYQGNVKLLNYGLAAAKTTILARYPEVATSDSFYHSPEQIRAKTLDWRSDLFSLACVAYHVMLGLHPFRGKSPSEIRAAIVGGEPPHPNTLQPSFGEPLSRFLLRALSNSPEARFSTPHEAKWELERALDGEVEVATEEVCGGYLREAFSDRYRLEQKAWESEDDDLLLEVCGATPGRLAGHAVSPRRIETIPPDSSGEQRLSEVSVEIQPKAGGVMVRVIGKLDAGFQPKEVLAALEGIKGPAVFDLSRVERMTSGGAARWISMLSGLRDRYYCLVRCSPVVVQQLQRNPDIVGTGEAISIHAPYVCRSCGKEVFGVVDLRWDRHLLAAAQPPPIPCTHCRDEAEFDEMPEYYFAGVAALPVPMPPSETSELIDGDRTIARQPFRLRMEVDGSVTALWMAGDLDRSARLKRIASSLEGVVVLEMSKLTSANAAGIERLLELLAEVQLDVYLARIPVEIAEQLQPRLPSRARVHSLRVPARCGACGFNGPVEMERPAEHMQDRLCHTCLRGLLMPALDPEAMSALFGPDVTGAPEEALLYLAAHPVSPRTSRASSGEFLNDPVSNTVNRSIGRYQLIRRIGTGGMAEVFLARQIGLHHFEKRVALKKLLPQHVQEPRFVELFLREAQLAARLSHPNVVQILDLGREHGEYFIAMEYVRGWDLADVLAAARALGLRLPVAYVCRIVADSCAGLHAAHTYVGDDGAPLPILHRDISPHNVLISTDGVPKITDFGIARAADSLPLTSVGHLRGRVAYMAPERVSGLDLDPRVDVFSMGVVLFESLALTTLFRRDTKYATLQAVLRHEVPPLSSFRDDVPAELEQIVLRALAPAPKDRYPTAEALAADLETFMAGANLQASPQQLSAWLRALFTKALELREVEKTVDFNPHPELADVLISDSLTPQAPGRSNS